MLNLLHAFRNKYHLKLGSRPSSPVMEFSAGLVLQYARQLPVVPAAERRPFFLSVPSKEHFTIHFSCTLLLYYLFENCFDPKKTGLEIGDKVELFGAVAKYLGTGRSGADRPVVRLLFANDVRYDLSASCAAFLNKSDAGRRLSRSPGSSKAHHAVNDLNTLFDFGLREAINPDMLSSKLYLVTGRGYAGPTRDRLRNESCINNSLAEAFRLGTNLIVTPDLEDIRLALTEGADEDNSFLIESLTDDLTELAEVYDGDGHLLDLVRRLAKCLERAEFTAEFRWLYTQLTDSIDNPHRTRLLNLSHRIPADKVGLSDALKVVVLANTGLAADYADTVSRLTAQGIPVVVLSDRAELASLSNEAAVNLTSGYRFCWSREQIKELMTTERTEYCDNRFWQQCTQYANQKISIRRYSDSAGDTLFSIFEFNTSLAQLDGFENLKKIYYQHLRPALYLLKNTPGSCPDIVRSAGEQAALFTRALTSVEGQLPADLACSLKQGLLELRNYTTNSKHLPDGLPVFTQQIEFPDGTRQLTAQLTPKSLRIPNLSMSESQALIFTGFPYREWNGKYLFDAVFSHLVRSVTVLAWPAEAAQATAYLIRKLQNAGFDNYMPQWIRAGIADWRLPGEQEQPDESGLIVQEGELTDPMATAEGQLPAKTIFEEVQRHIDNFRFSHLIRSVRDTGEYLVPADVLHFHNGSYMLLPHGRSGHINAVSRQYGITGDICQACFQELSIGDLIVCFNMNRDIVRRLSREHLTSAYEHLDVWRSRLHSLLDGDAGQFTRLETLLMRRRESLGLPAGNPSRQNILRWLYETDLLAPQNANLWLILLASGLSEPEAKTALGRIDSAKRLIIRTSSDVSDRIRDELMTVIRKDGMQEESILLDVDGVSVAVQCGYITDKEKRTDLEVPYDSAKQFIKD